MDPFIIGLTCCGIIVMAIIGLLLYQSRTEKQGQRRRPAPQAVQQHPGGVRRAQVARGVRQRHRAQAAREDSDHESADDNEEAEEGELPKVKMGAKKLAKMQEKAERRAQLEVEKREREERKQQQELQDEERQKERELEELEEKKKEEQERKAREEKEKKEYEEYLKMKAAFSVEEEGFEEGETDSESNLLIEFIKYIKETKVVVLEDLAAQFRLKTQSVIERIQDLQEEGTLTGVIDDRGKFIYISQEELESVSKFVKQRGRVSITDLAEHSNKLINLNPSSRPEVCTS